MPSDDFVNVYCENIKLSIDLRDLDETCNTGDLKNRIVIYFKQKISIDNIKLFIIKKINGIPIRELIRGNPLIINNANYTFRLEHISITLKIPVEIKTGFDMLTQFKNGKPYIKSFDGMEYNGDIANELPHGNGILTSSNGYIYEGQFNMGVKEGLGKEILPNGDMYEGEFINNFPNGQGIYKSINGTTWEGLFSDGMKNGRIIEKLPNGDFKVVSEMEECYQMVLLLKVNIAMINLMDILN